MLVILSPGFPSDESDTSCLPAIQQFVQCSAKLYPEITLITFQYPFNQKEYLWHGIRIISLGGKNKKGLRRILTWAKALIVLMRIHKNTPVSGILSLWLTECAFIGQIFSRLKKIKHLIWLIGQDTKKSNRYAKIVKAKASQQIAMSEFIRREAFKNHGVSPDHVVENGIKPEKFSSLNVGAREFDIIGVGSLIPLKNYKLFIEIVASVKKKHPALKCAIVGDGPESAILQDMAQRLVPDTIKFMGNIPHLQVLELMNHSKILLHVSKFEGHSTVILEALYSGCRVICSENASQEVITDLFIEKTNEQIIKRLTFLLNEQHIAIRNKVPTMDDSAAKILNLLGVY